MTTEDSVRAAIMAEELKRLRDLGPVHVQVDPFDAFVLIAALQLAWRHPELSDRQRSTIERFGRGLQAAFKDYDVPQIALTLEQGWRREYDRRVEQ